MLLPQIDEPHKLTYLSCLPSFFLLNIIDYQYIYSYNFFGNSFQTFHIIRMQIQNNTLWYKNWLHLLLSKQKLYHAMSTDRLNAKKSIQWCLLSQESRDSEWFLVGIGVCHGLISRGIPETQVMAGRAVP